MKITVDDKIPFIRGILENFAEVSYLPGSKISNSDVKDSDALIVRTRTACNQALLENTSVRFIATATIGYDHIDTNYCDSHGIKWTNAAGCNSSSVAQYMTAALLSLAVKHNFSLSQKTIGIAGVGNVGSKVAVVAEALGMNVLLNDPPRHEAENTNIFLPLAKLLKESDIITLHVPLTGNGKYPTYHMADINFFRELSHRKPFFINASRGEVTDTTALKTALKDRLVSGAVLDVWESEPFIDPELMNICELATPHIAGYSTDGKANGTSMSVKALAEFFGLDLKNWYPTEVPLPQNTEIRISSDEICNESFEKIMLNAVSQTYNICEDDKKLRESPQTFEDQRGSYPLRREFTSYTVHIDGIVPENNMEKATRLKTAFEKLGFKLAQE